ncbi:MAG: hypothetical protein GDA36_02780 [Rhodobacteraceae bacterium]|nr:hypothetical protein [Paracoccaceae bacterium]
MLWRGRQRDGIMRTAARHRSPVINPSSSTPAGLGTTRGQADLQAPLAGLSNAYATMKHRPIVRAGQNKTSSWRWGQSGRTCGELPDRTEWPNLLLFVADFGGARGELIGAIGQTSGTSD